MRKYILLISFFLFACKKEEKGTKISVRQQPSRIAIFTVDTANGSQTLQYDIQYYYNDSTSRFDSITVGGLVSRFNYSLLGTQNKILLNFTDSLAGYNEIIFNPDFYTLNAYNEIPPTGTTSTCNLQYDGNKRITNLSYSNYPSAGNFSQHFSYNYDSTFIHTVRPYDGCETNDTIMDSFYALNTTMPYLLFTNIHSTCGIIGLNVLRALPLSNHAYKLPASMTNDLFKTTFTYRGDTNSRLAEATVITRYRGNNQMFRKLKIEVTY